MLVQKTGKYELGQLDELQQMHFKRHALIKYSIFALFDDFLFLFIQIQYVIFSYS
jgi:hypothetical protein